jgi:hypothetical protein
MVAEASAILSNNAVVNRSGSQAIYPLVLSPRSRGSIEKTAAKDVSHSDYPRLCWCSHSGFPIHSNKLHLSNKPERTDTFWSTDILGETRSRTLPSTPGLTLLFLTTQGVSLDSSDSSRGSCMFDELAPNAVTIVDVFSSVPIVSGSYRKSRAHLRIVGPV